MDKYTIASESINKTRKFFNSLGLSSKLKNVGIGEENLEAMAKAAIGDKDEVIGKFKPLYYKDVLTIYKNAL